MQRQKMPGLLLGALDGSSLEQRVRLLLDRRLLWSRKARVTAAARCALIVGSLCAGSAMVSANTTQNALPRFEVVSIKRTPPGVAETGVHVYPGGRLVIHATNLKELIVFAYNLGYWQVSGGDDWVQKESFDIEGIPPESWRQRLPNADYSIFGIREEPVRQMLQALLKDRFGLKLREDSKTGVVSVLEKNGKPIALRPAKTDRPKSQAKEGLTITGEVSRINNSHWYLFNTSTAQLSGFLSSYVLHHPVLDRTGLDGSYDYDYQLLPTDADTQSGQSADISQILMVLPKMGLKLSQEQGQVETFVIEHVDRPTEN